MKKINVPIGRAARYAFIEEMADEAIDNFENGNRSDVLEMLDGLPPRVAYAVVAMMAAKAMKQGSIVRWLREVA